MDRPGYITRCPVCFAVVVVPDGPQFVEDPHDKRKKVRNWKTEPDAVIAAHIRGRHA